MKKIFLGKYYLEEHDSIICFSKNSIATTLHPTGTFCDTNWFIEVSSQIGCPVGCHFCNLPQFSKNLGAKDIKEQVDFILAIAHASKFPIRNDEKIKLSFTDGGEILLNPNFGEIMEYVVSSQRFQIVKFSSILPATNIVKENFELMLAFAKKNPEMIFQFQVSLHGNDEARKKIAKANVMLCDEIVELVRHYYEITRRQTILSFTLAEGVSINPAELSALFARHLVKIRLYALKSHAKNRALGINGFGKEYAEKLVAEFLQHGMNAYYYPNRQESRVGYSDPSNEPFFLEYGREVIM